MFEKELRAARQADSNLSAAIRARKPSWGKLWTEELFPLWLYVNYNEKPDDDEFRIMSEGNPVDAELRALSGEVTRFQITMAYGERDPPRSGGYIASMEREGVNQGVPVFLGGGTNRDASGRIKSEPRVLSPDRDHSAWRSGLVKAIQNKIDKAAIYAGSVDCLLVYAERLWFDLIDEDPRDVILSAIHESLPGAKTVPFRSLVVIGQNPSAYVVYQPTNLPTTANGTVAG
jgi:hypothetical protein